jgi:hypothetical protein
MLLTALSAAGGQKACTTMSVQSAVTPRHVMTRHDAVSACQLAIGGTDAIYDTGATKFLFINH